MRPRDHDRVYSYGYVPTAPLAPAKPAKWDRGKRGPAERSKPSSRERRPSQSSEPARPGGQDAVVRLYLGAGRRAGIRTGDLVGAITGEAGVTSRDLGAIEIADRFSLVEVPEAIAEHVITALRGSTIRGKKVTVRRERF